MNNNRHGQRVLISLLSGDDPEVAQSIALGGLSHFDPKEAWITLIDTNKPRSLAALYRTLQTPDGNIPQFVCDSLICGKIDDQHEEVIDLILEDSKKDKDIARMTHVFLLSLGNLLKSPHTRKTLEKIRGWNNGFLTGRFDQKIWGHVGILADVPEYMDFFLAYAQHDITPEKTQYVLSQIFQKGGDGPKTMLLEQILPYLNVSKNLEAMGEDARDCLYLNFLKSFQYEKNQRFEVLLPYLPEELFPTRSFAQALILQHPMSPKPSFLPLLRRNFEETLLEYQILEAEDTFTTRLHYKWQRRYFSLMIDTAFGQMTTKEQAQHKDLAKACVSGKCPNIERFVLSKALGETQHGGAQKKSKKL